MNYLKHSFVLFLAVGLYSPRWASAQTPIDIAHAPAPLFDDPIWHGASDPFVIWNPAKNQWFMYYTQRRATLPNPTGVDWVHGSAIGIAASTDGTKWTYLGTCKGDHHDLTDPLAAKGLGPEPGVTWWAPCYLQVGPVMHMWVVEVDGVYTRWMGQRHILHFTSDDGLTWKYVSTAKLSSDRVIDPTVYNVAGTWYMVYKDEAAGSRTYCSQSTDLDNWTDAKPASPDGHQEAPFVFQWRSKWWLMVDALGNGGLRIYTSPNGTGAWKYSSTILNHADGRRWLDHAVGHHPGIVIQGSGDQQQCLVFYFTQRGPASVIQLAELDLDADGKAVCDRNKYAPAGATAGPATRP
jgi:hypothetical protein